MARTAQQIVEQTLGAYAVQCATLQAQIEALQERIAILEKAQKPETEPTS